MHGKKLNDFFSCHFYKSLLPGSFCSSKSFLNDWNSVAMIQIKFAPNPLGERLLRRISLRRKPQSWSKMLSEVSKSSIKVITSSKVRFDHFIESLTSIAIKSGSFWLKIMFSTKWFSTMWSTFDKEIKFDFRRSTIRCSDPLSSPKVVYCCSWRRKKLAQHRWQYKIFCTFCHHYTSHLFFVVLESLK